MRRGGILIVFLLATLQAPCHVRLAAALDDAPQRALDDVEQVVVDPEADQGHDGERHGVLVVGAGRELQIDIESGLYSLFPMKVVSRAATKRA